MKIGVLGSGIVAQTLAAGFLTHGYETIVGTRDKSKLAEWNRANPKARLGSFSETAAFADVVVLAVKGLASAEAVRAAGDNVSGKVVIDATNPIADAAPENGLLKLSSSLDESLMERLQREFPRARFVKAFSSVGYLHFVDPQFGGVKPTMFICGNDGAAKKTVADILDQFGWEAADMGTVEAARAIEPLCILWCIPGLLRNEWNHAFKLLKK
jgi:8-hydroxy-5-deazaflavin:NADPH oxidoreductase